MTLEDAIKEVIKNYWEADENTEAGQLEPKIYNKKYFEDREAEYLPKDKDKNNKDKK